MRSFLLGFTVLTYIFLSSMTYADSPECENDVLAMEKKKNGIDVMGGVWTLFEINAVLNKESIRGLRLDSKINEIIDHSQYLCKNLNGLPFNELQEFVSTNINNSNEEEFRNHLIILGKTHEEIDIWFKFSLWYEQNKHRTLAPHSVNISIKKVTRFIDEYVSLFHKYKETGSSELLSDSTQTLFREVTRFIQGDSNMTLSVYEKAQIPYWDVNEDEGGS